jgi:hypothetical protein
LAYPRIRKLGKELGYFQVPSQPTLSPLDESQTEAEGKRRVRAGTTVTAAFERSLRAPTAAA